MTDRQREPSPKRAEPSPFYETEQAAAEVAVKALAALARAVPEGKLSGGKFGSIQALLASIGKTRTPETPAAQDVILAENARAVRAAELVDPDGSTLGRALKYATEAKPVNLWMPAIDIQAISGTGVMKGTCGVEVDAQGTPVALVAGNERWGTGVRISLIDDRSAAQGELPKKP